MEKVPIEDVVDFTSAAILGPADRKTGQVFAVLEAVVGTVLEQSAHDFDATLDAMVHSLKAQHAERVRTGKNLRSKP